MRSVRTTLVVGLGITAVAVAVVMAGAPMTVLATNSIHQNEQLATTDYKADACQSGESLPRGTTAIRLSLGAFTGPAVAVKAISAARVVVSGERGSGWAGQTVTVPVTAVSRTISPVKICFSIPVVGDEQVTVFGGSTAPSLAARTRSGAALAGRLRIEYLQEGRSSWLSLLPSVARHMGLGRAWSGIWIAPLVAMLMLAATITTSRLIRRELDG